MSYNKLNVYQVFTRLFGNTQSHVTPWGTIEQNGVGKFSDFTPLALQKIHELGMTHIWYTGVPHHAVINDYSDIGINNDHPTVVKGRAGSPYAVKDYYNVNPDLADDASQRLQEFESLVERSHQANLKVIIDIVPNHVARQYQSTSNPAGTVDFGANDDTSVEYAKHNNFYYIPQAHFELPDIPQHLQPLGGEKHPSMATPFEEYPAKWTGNGSRLAKPDVDDWYETVKVNYGVRPDGTKDFDTLPEHYRTLGHQEHFEFWQGKDVPDSWIKFRDIALYWIEKGVDGFRYDMAEMVPVEFWSYMNASIKMRNPDAFLMAEVYQPHLYRDYIQLGKMDYLYDKVDLYDTLKAIMQGTQSTQAINSIQRDMLDIEHHMLHFLDNHDEQRIASPEFAGNADKGKPAMLVSALLSTSPTMIYFGQEVGEPGDEMAGFGQPTRTSIFDYVGVPHHQRWMNDGKFDGGQLTEKEANLRQFYQKLLNFTLASKALEGDFDALHEMNEQQMSDAFSRCYVFARSNVTDDQSSIVIAAANFDAQTAHEFELTIPAELISKWGLSDGTHLAVEHIEQSDAYQLKVTQGVGALAITLPPLGAIALTL
jgi:glycosidase